MELKFMAPNIKKTLSNLGFANENKVVQRKISGWLAVLPRSYNLYSDIRGTDGVVAVLPTEAGEKHSGFEEYVKLVSPRITVKGYRTDTRGFTNYLLHADDMVREQKERGEMMRLANDVVLDKNTTSGGLKFSTLHCEVGIQNEDGSVSDEIKEHTYDLKPKGQGRIVQVGIPAGMPLEELDYNARIGLINPIMDTITTTAYQRADVDWYIKTDDIVLTKDSSLSKARPQAGGESTQDKQSLGRKGTFSHGTAW